MAAPGKQDLCWQRLLTTESPPEFKALATKLMVARLRREVKQKPSALPTATEELSAFFSANAFAQQELTFL
jgi:hypothetical protein